MFQAATSIKLNIVYGARNDGYAKRMSAQFEYNRTKEFKNSDIKLLEIEIFRL